MLGGILQPVTSALLPAPPADLTRVVKAADASNPLLGQSCFVDSGQKVMLSGQPIYRQVRCTADTT